MKNSRDIDYYILLTLLLLIISTLFLKAFSRDFNNLENILGFIEKCIDGDTLKVRRYDGMKMTVRVLGVDTFETEENKQAERQAKDFDLDIETVTAIGTMAKQFCVHYWQGKDVVLSCWKKDKYKRDLCFVSDTKNNDLGDFMIKNRVGYYVKPY